MRAAVLTGVKQVTVEDRPEPSARPGWVVVKVESASLAEVASDPSDLTVGYTVNYVMKSGDRSTQRIRLQLERLDDRLLIAGEG